MDRIHHRCSSIERIGVGQYWPDGLEQVLARFTIPARGMVEHPRASARRGARRSGRPCLPERGCWGCRDA